MYFDAKEFGKRLHDVRTSGGITQEELAVRLGLASKQHVSRMENGERSCSIDLLIELSCILHVSTDYLLMGSEPSKEEVKNDLLSIISELSTIAKKIYIPLDDLREHLDELDRGKPVYVNCQTGLRSYLACRLLTQYGFTCAHLSGGYSFYQVVTQERQTAQSAYPCGMETL